MKPRFQVGGTLIPGTSVYVKRQEDREFLECLALPTSWINIYGCRTMGKSSLYARYLPDLREQGTRVIALDMAAEVGSRSPTPRDWVCSLGSAIAAKIGVGEHTLIRDAKKLSSDAPAGNVLERVIVDGLLKQCKSPVLLILDEYDIIKGFEFCDDILFALRHLQAIQAQTHRLDRLSVCVVGLEPLSRLGKPGAADTSPIAVPIEMLDFKLKRATVETLTRGFSADERPDASIVHRVLELSGGQPLVTMVLLRAVERKRCRTIAAVNKLSREMVSESGQGADLQLFESIERAIVEQGSEGFTALQAYEALLKGSPEAHTAPRVDLLLLFGLVRRKGDRLEPKGELFRRRFDVDWADRMLSRIASGMQQYRGGARSKGKRICIINTGGTIGMVQRGAKVVPPRDADEFRSYFNALPSIAEVVEFENLFPPRDSINVFPDQWTTIAKYIYSRRHHGFDGFVVAHGTDTMAYTASAVAFALGPQLRFPVVFTGAQTTPDVAYGDAHVNLYRACEAAKKEIPEVVICFGNFVYRAVRAQKKDDRRFDGFESPTYPPLAEITGEINIRPELLRPVPKVKKDIILRSDFEKSILMVPQFPGLEPEFFDLLLQGGDGRLVCNGVIVQTLGAGNVASEVPYSFIPFVRRAYRRGIPVIVTSQYPPEPGSHAMYSPAQAPIQAGAIHAGNLTLAAAVTKFRWVMANLMRRGNWVQLPPDRKRKLVAKLMVETSVVGEF